MKKIITAIISVLLIASMLVGCGKERELYQVNLSKHIEVGEYTGVTVDTNSKEYKEYYQSNIDNDVKNGSYYNEIKEGKVQNGDIANIDYLGKKDGVAFEGGTDKGYDLEIGSGTFIDGFESQLIGVEVGKTVDINVTFPENYDKEELKGAPVVFTVTINSIKRAQEPKEYFRNLKFKTLKSYEDDLKKRSAISCIMDALLKEVNVTKYPSEDVDKIYESEYKLMEQYYQNYYGMSMDSVISSYGMTEDAFKEAMLENSVYPQIKEQMMLYYILDAEKMTCTEQEVENYINEMVEENKNLNKETLKKTYGDYYFESLFVKEKVSDFLYEKAVLK
ncbi:MAG: FKBP-type peptidyl-prolyl cis-trans isomerase [Oscillospiraceae bacterium]|nr:FKBP-type peptidyl-prolyl cis-trans isomerase [Oscillospiraceae bacterium]